jgi:apolipoprotein N-acyltransferase
MQNFPLIRWATHHPRLAAWIVLAAGMVFFLVIEARDVGLLATQWIALIVATVLVAGLCIWIISWEDEDENPTTTVEAATKDTPTAEKSKS